MILDNYGNPVSSTYRFNRSAQNWSGDRPWLPIALSDIDKLIPPSSRRILMSVSRVMVENFGPCTAIAEQIPMYSIGRAWRPSLNTSAAIKDTAQRIIRDEFCPLAGLDGKDFTTKLWELAHLLIRDGEAFYLLTEWETGFPAIQIIPAHRIGQRDDAKNEVEDGEYRGLAINDGIITNEYGTPVAYRVLGETPDDDEDISARSMKHVFDSRYPESKRGYPRMAHALNDARDSMQAHDWERLNMLVRSSITYVEHTETGIPDDDPFTNFEDEDGNSTGKIETGSIFGGTVRTVRARSGYKLEQIGHEAPGEIYESFDDRIIRKICTGVPWPFSFVWEGHESGGGVSERRDIMQARHTIEDVQAIIMPHARRMLGYAYQKRVKSGDAPQTKDWWRWVFSMPPKLTVDDGRVQKSRLDLWRAGILSDGDMLDDLGKDEDEHWVEKFRKAAQKEIQFQQAQEEFDVVLDPRVKGMFTPNQTNEDSKGTSNTEDDED